MNMFNLDVTQRCLIAECWCPVEELDEIQRALIRGSVYQNLILAGIYNVCRLLILCPTVYRNVVVLPFLRSWIAWRPVSSLQPTTSSTSSLEVSRPLLMLTVWPPTRRSTLVSQHSLCICVWVCVCMRGCVCMWMCMHVCVTSHPILFNVGSIGHPAGQTLSSPCTVRGNNTCVRQQLSCQQCFTLTMGCPGIPHLLSLAQLPTHAWLTLLLTFPSQGHHILHLHVLVLQIMILK